MPYPVRTDSCAEQKQMAATASVAVNPRTRGAMSSRAYAVGTGDGDVDETLISAAACELRAALP